MGQPMSKKFKLILAAALFFLSACAHKSTQLVIPAALQHEKHATILEHIQSFQATGRLKFRTFKEQTTASFSWLEQDGVITTELFGPLGLGTIHLHVENNGQSTLKAEGKIYTASNPESLLAETAGLKLPISFLRFWLKGMPSPRYYPEFQNDSVGKLVSLRQDNLHLKYLQYHQGPVPLPQKIEVKHPEFELTMIIHDARVLAWK